MGSAGGIIRSPATWIFITEMTTRAAEGTEIYAAADGLVTTAGTHRSYGNYLIIQHSDGLSTLYAHCSSLLVESRAAGICR